MKETTYAGDAFAVQYKSFTACFLVIIPSSNILQTFFVPFGNPVISPHKNRYIVGFNFVVDSKVTKNSDKTKNGNNDGITEL